MDFLCALDSSRESVKCQVKVGGKGASFSMEDPEQPTTYLLPYKDTCITEVRRYHYFRTVVLSGLATEYTIMYYDVAGFKEVTAS